MLGPGLHLSTSREFSTIASDASLDTRAIGKAKLCFHKSDPPNVGDDLNSWLWPRLMPDLFDETSGTAFVGIGSILDCRFDGFSRKIVFGAGARSPSTVPTLDDTWHVAFVRGPLTAKALQLGDRYAVSDPALMLARYFKRTTDARSIGIVPYFRSNALTWQRVADAIGAVVVPPTLPVNGFLRSDAWRDYRGRSANSVGSHQCIQQ
jgi:succinoglycan biosynthesis protein ExoV